MRRITDGITIALNGNGTVNVGAENLGTNPIVSFSYFIALCRVSTCSA